MNKYIIIDYYSGRLTLKKLFNDKKEAYRAKEIYLTEKFKSKEIHNNLLCIVSVTARAKELLNN